MAEGGQDDLSNLINGDRAADAARKKREDKEVLDNETAQARANGTVGAANKSGANGD